jgi:hypothetical protein
MDELTVPFSPKRQGDIEFEQRVSQKELDLLRSESKSCFKPSKVEHRLIQP